MNKREKRQLIFLLEKFRKDIIKNWPRGNNLPYELSLNQLDISAEEIVDELKAQLDKNYSFKDLK